MGEIHTLGQLDGHIIDHLNITARNVYGKIQVQLLDVLVDVTILVLFNHGELSIADLLREAIESCNDV